jgi:hypothetical protein
MADKQVTKRAGQEICHLAINCKGGSCGFEM